ncbi:MAG: FAD-dependent oxidoreductase, partial [Burkholderiaceae bacterium]
MGAGIVGLATAYELQRLGMRVTVVDQAHQPGAGASGGNGAQLSYSYVQPLADAGIWAQLPQLLLSPDSPLKLRPQWDPHQWRWGLDFLRACNRRTSERSTAALLALAARSRAGFERMLAAEQLDCDFARTGKLVLYATPAAFDAARRQMELQRAWGYYRALDPSLTPEAFAARKLSVPAPEIGDDGLDAEEFRRRHGVNPFVDTRRDHLSTFAMDVDTASWTIARNALRSGKLPDPAAVRTEEFVNAIRDAAAGDLAEDPDSAFSFFGEGGPSPFGRGLELLKLTVKARELRPGERKNAVLTLVVDTSGSMAASVSRAGTAGAASPDATRLELVRDSLRTLVDALGPDDRVGIVAYSTHSYLVLPHAPARDRGRILGAISSLEPSGATNVESGLDLGYRVADEVFDPKALNRIVLCSDGVANLGAKGPEEILRKVEVFSRRGVYLSSVGFGMGKYDDRMLETLANRGNGNYAYVDTVAEAERIFRENLPSTLQVLAQDAKIQVDFNPEVVSHYRLLGYENRDIRDEDFRNDKVDAGEVGPGTTVTVLYELRRHANPRGDLGRIYLRYKDVGTGRVEEASYPLSLGLLATRVEDTTDRFRLAACVAEMAELLRKSRWARDGSFGAVLALLRTLSPELAARPEASGRYLPGHTRCCSREGLAFSSTPSRSFHDAARRKFHSALVSRRLCSAIFFLRVGLEIPSMSLVWVMFQPVASKAFRIWTRSASARVPTGPAVRPLNWGCSTDTDLAEMTASSPASSAGDGVQLPRSRVSPAVASAQEVSAFSSSRTFPG